MELKGSYMTTLFMIVAVVSVVFFLLAGYAYPATDEDMAKNRAFPFYSNGNYDRGLFTQFFTSLAFTVALMLLGFYVTSTFVANGVKHWTIAALGIFLMFIYGLGKIGELTYGHETFDEFKDLVLPVALIVMAYASYKISASVEGGK